MEQQRQSWIVWHNYPEDFELRAFTCFASTAEDAVRQCLALLPECDPIEAEKVN